MRDRRKPDQDPRTGRFQPGNNGGTGRPKGVRNKLSEAFLAELQADFEAHGPAVIAQVRENRPVDYLRIIAQLVPKECGREADGDPDNPVVPTEIKIRIIEPTGGSAGTFAPPRLDSEDEPNGSSCH